MTKKAEDVVSALSRCEVVEIETGDVVATTPWQDVVVDCSGVDDVIDARGPKQ